jgi:AAA15 family ATPase/GTPase
MSYKYNAIKLDNKFSFYKNEDGSSVDEIKSLSSINIIVGSNNSGKSRFLRELIKIQDFQYKVEGFSLIKLNKQLKDLEDQIKAVGEKYNNVATFRTTNHPSMAPKEIRFTYPGEYISSNFFSEKYIQKTTSLLNSLKNEQYVMDTYRVSNNISTYEIAMKGLLVSNTEIFENLKKYEFEETKFKKFYIPTLRSLNYLGIDDSHKKVDFYKLRISKKYDLNEENLNLDIFTGLSLYYTVRSMLLGDADQRKRIASYEEFLSTKLFDGKEVSLIPKEKDDVLHIKIGNEERAIYDLGDGIQSLIILTFPLFEVKCGLFFIEEPEMHLHPALQRKLIEVLKEMKNHQYFITTHSNHFLDLTLDYTDTSVYSFNKRDDKTTVKLVSQADENILQLLGARNTSVFLSNCTIWVEGITDRLYIRKYLELYQNGKDQKIQEDIDYSFVEYGGDNITHWSFLDQEESPINIERLCGKSFLITDKDGDKNMERKEQLKQTLGDRYNLLDCNEIENTLSLKTIERVLRKYEKKNTFTMPIFRKEQPHKDIRIGKFIEERIFGTQSMTRKGGYKEDSGTIKNKVDFCKKALENMTHEEISPIALKLAEKIYNFVTSS